MKVPHTFICLSAALLAGAVAAQATRKVSDAWTLDAISYNARLAADWMTANPKNHNPRDWTYGAFYAGIAALGLSDPTQPYLGQIRELGEQNQWKPLTRTYHADDHCIGQSWLELAAFDNNPVYAEPLRQTYDHILANPHTGPLDFTTKDNQKRWSWCDALFMSPTVLVRLYGLTGEAKYLTFMDQEYKATTDYLFSKEDHFFFRDSRYFEKQTKNGKHVYWCRGNGWVFGSLPLILRDLPADWPTRGFYLDLFRQMAAALKNAQHADGAWRPSLCDRDDPDMQEMSGTSFFTYGLLWGINNGVLDRAEYLPCVQKAWTAITRNIRADGHLGWVQPIGERPVASYTAEDTEVYAVGAYLCAAMELRKLVIADAHANRKTVAFVNPLGTFRSAETITLDWAKLGMNADKVRVFDVRNGAVLPHQLMDANGDGSPDKLIFKTYMLARQSRAFWVFESDAVPAAPAVTNCFRRYAPDEASAAAWIRGDDETYDNTPYTFLGQQDWTLRFDVKPRPGAALELLWGSKNDVRTAVVQVDGQALPVSGGGDYRGFRWLRVPLPETVKGERYDIVMKSGQGPAAFLAEVRLTVPGGDPNRPSLAQPGYRANGSLKKRAEAIAGKAFSEMRKVWDEPSASFHAQVAARPDGAVFKRCEENARQANEALYRSRRFVDGWLARADPETGLIPRNLNESRDFWNGRDSAADNYPFMVLTAAMTDRSLFEGRMLEMLRTETRLTCRVGRIPDDYSFSKRGWRREKVELDAITFDGAEYVKDGLLPIMEWLGPSPWSERALGIIDDIWANAAIETPFGKIPTLNFEVNGDLLQACARLFWFTGERKYLDWAIRLGDYYLCGTNHPTRDLGELSLGDHSCEVINGLSEIYAACSVAAPDKRDAYRKPLHEMYDRILEVGRNSHGLFYLTVDPRTGQHSDALTDNWGYNCDGFHTVWLLDGKTAYRDAVRLALGNLKEHYTGKGGMGQSHSADGYADSIEGAITLLNREPVASAAEWVDAEIRTMWGRQKADGVIEGWHGDGNSARTSLMYALWKTQGILVQPWREDVRFGAVRADGVVHLVLTADRAWSGKILFDRPRHKANLHLPLDYPRINQFPEWFVVEPDAAYSVTDAGTGTTEVMRSSALADGVPVSVMEGGSVCWVIRERGDKEE